MKASIKFLILWSVVVTIMVTVSTQPLLARPCDPLDGRTLKERLDQIVMGGNLAEIDDLFSEQSCLALADMSPTEPQAPPPACERIDGRLLKEKLDQLVMGGDPSAIGELFEQYDSPLCQ